MKDINNQYWAILLLSFAGLTSCSSSSSQDDTTEESGSATVPTVFSSSYKSAVTLSSDGTSVTMKSNASPPIANRA